MISFSFHLSLSFSTSSSSPSGISLFFFFFFSYLLYFYPFFLSNNITGGEWALRIKGVPSSGMLWRDNRGGRREEKEGGREGVRERANDKRRGEGRH